MFEFLQPLKKLTFPLLSSFDVYFDFGTSNTKIALKNKGIVLKEPTYLGYNNKTREYLFFGNEAKSIVGKTPEFIKIIRPVVSGIIYDFDAHVSLIRYFFEKSVSIYLNKYNLFRPSLRAVSSVPYSATEIEKKAVEEVLSKLGFSSVFLIEKPLANAVGAGLNVFSHHPGLLVDLGGGLIEATIISGGGIVSQKTLKNAGENMNKIIANYIYLKQGIILGESTCENIKISLLNFTNEEKIITVRGKSLETGLPKSIRIKSSEIKEALLTNFTQIVDIIKELIEISPPEVVDEIYNQGIILCGGLANIPGINDFFKDEIKVDVNIARPPSDLTIDGLINIGKNLETLAKLAIPKV